MSEPKITRRKITDYLPDPSNANLSSERGHRMIDDSVSQDGAGRSGLADKNGTLIAGNQTLQAMVDNGIEDVIEIETSGKEWVIVRRNDADLNDPDPNNLARRMAFRDNRTQELSLRWNPEQLLADLNAGVDLSQFFQADELDELLAELRKEEQKEDAGAQTDRAGELQAIWQVARGDVWQIGRHKLMCGDSTSAADVARLMGGERAELLATDPPYNVGFDYAGATDDSKADADYQRFCTDWFKVWSEVSERQIVTPGGVNFTWWVRRFDIYHVGIWAKLNALTRGKVSVGWVWEPVLFFGEHWKRDRASDIFDYPITNQQGVANHPCPKPLPMWVDLIENYTDTGAIVCDAFAGSGTTLVACEQTGRIGFGMEISPEYCSVILERLHDMGLTPELDT